MESPLRSAKPRNSSVARCAVASWLLLSPFPPPAATTSTLIVSASRDAITIWALVAPVDGNETFADENEEARATSPELEAPDLEQIVVQTTQVGVGDLTDLERAHVHTRTVNSRRASVHEPVTQFTPRSHASAALPGCVGSPGEHI